VILGGDVAVRLCLLLSAHRAVIFAIGQLSCFAFVLVDFVDNINGIWHL